MNRLAATFATALLALLALAPAAGAKDAVDFFGGSGPEGGHFGEPRGVAVNDTGAGPANPGDVYVVDSNQNRIQRFGRDDAGTPAATGDDTYFFISTWGADVVQGSGAGDAGDEEDANFEICVNSFECKAGIASGGNGTEAGNGALDSPKGIAIDADTGNLYVFDRDNRRVNAYDGAGNFLFSVGRDVAEPNGGTAVEICDGATDTCRAGDPGSGPGEIGTGFANLGFGIAISPANGNASTGTLFLADSGNQRVNTYDLDGSNPASIGSAAQFESGFPALVAVDSRGILYANNLISGGLGGGGEDARIERYDTEDANGSGIGFLAPIRSAINENQRLSRNATAGQYRLTFKGGDTTADIPYNASEETVQAALEALPSIGIRNVAVGDCNCAENYYTVRFSDDLAGSDVPQLVVSNGTTPLTGTVSINTIFDGFNGGGANEIQQLTVAATAGTYKLSFDPDGGGPKPTETTVTLPYDALPYDQDVINACNTPGIIDTIQEALQALPSIGNNRSVLVFGGPNVAVGSGGSCNHVGSAPYDVFFQRALGATDVAELTVVDSTLSGGAGASVTTRIPGQSGLIPGFLGALAVDPDSDGAGPDEDVLYASGAGATQQFGPLNDPGLTAPPAEEDDRHATGPALVSNGDPSSPGGLAAEPSTGRLYAASSQGVAGTGVYVLDDVNQTPPTASLDSCDQIAATGFTCHATIDPNGLPATSYRFQYVDDPTFGASGFTNAKSTDTVLLGAQLDPQSIEARIEPPGAGLLANTTYHVRLAFQRRFTAEQFTAELTPTTLALAPGAETTGSPLRTATTATLLGRLLPNGTATTYRFQYGTQGPCDANPCTETAPIAAGAGHQIRIASDQIADLDPSTTYHYRIAAENGVGGTVFGEDRTLATRASDELPNQNDRSRFPGPPASDRAYELVSLPDTGGNPIGALGAQAYANDGNRAVYSVFGGTPISDTGSLLGLYYAERPAGEHPGVGWQTRIVTPPRSELAGPLWESAVYGADDLTRFTAFNVAGTGAVTQVTHNILWQLTPGLTPVKLFDAQRPAKFGNTPNGGADYRAVGVSADGSRVVAYLQDGTFDPAFPAAGQRINIYDLSVGGGPQLLSIMPSGDPPACGLALRAIDSIAGIGAFSGPSPQVANWVADDGSRVYFPSSGDSCALAPQLYVRDIGAAETELVSGPPLSGPACEAGLIRANSQAAFFATKTRLDPDDVEPSSCGSGTADNDVYRYDLATEELRCLTCLVTGLPADVEGNSLENLAIAADGSRLYFSSAAHLLAGVHGSGIYRLDIASGDLAYVAPGSRVGPNQPDTDLSSDGRFLAFRSDRAELEPLGGAFQNADHSQYYLYDDLSRSLVCVSCPPDGSSPLDDAGDRLTTSLLPGSVGITGLAEDGTLAFITTTPLVGDDHNTPSGPDLDPGIDIYEYRDGRQLLITDGTTSWPPNPPMALAVSPSGRDVFFSAPARYTQDAIDDNRRLYTARIGGGIDFPPPGLPPCDLNSGACEGPGTSAPDRPGAGTAVFQGPGNPPHARKEPCPKGKVKRRGRCFKKNPKRHHKRAHRNRRAGR